jgi:hypothetical protein
MLRNVTIAGRRILRWVSRAMTAQDVRRALIASGIDLGQYAQALTAISMPSNRWHRKGAAHKKKSKGRFVFRFNEREDVE